MHGLKARRGVAPIEPMIDAIAVEFPRIQDAKMSLCALALREKVPSTKVIAYFMKATPEQTRYCPDCKEDVPYYEFANGMCLDCVQAAYTRSAS